MSLPANSEPPRSFALIGDSNVRDNMNPTNCRDRPLMSSAQVLICTKLPVFQQTLRSVAPSANVCILGCVTNFLTDSSEAPSLYQRVEPTMTEFFRLVVEFCKASQEREVLVCPPMYRKSPVWYRDGLPEVLTIFSTSYAQNAVLIKNIHALPGFPTPSFNADGIHLTPYSGMEYVLHLFDSAKVVLDSMKSEPEDREIRQNEIVRALGDRMIAVEQDHRRLSEAVDLKIAIDSELACFRANERNEDSFIISGVRRIRDGLSGRGWQDEAKKEVQRVLKLFYKEEFRIVVVHNVSGRSKESDVTFSVRLSSVDDARMIRAKFSSYFAGGRDARPKELKGIGIRNVLTKETRIRISIMKILGARYQDSNSGSSFKMVGFESRPILKIIPPEGASDKRIRSFNFIEAVQKLRVSFTDQELAVLSKQIGPQFSGRLKSLFVVLDDDKIREIRSKARSDRNKRVRAQTSDDEAPPSRRHAEDS